MDAVLSKCELTSICDGADRCSTSWRLAFKHMILATATSTVQKFIFHSILVLCLLRQLSLSKRSKIRMGNYKLFKDYIVRAFVA